MVSRFNRVLLVATVTAAATMVGLVGSASATVYRSEASAVVEPWLAGQLARTGPADSVVVMIHGTSVASARAAATRAGLTPAGELARIGIAIASGVPSQVRLAARQPGVTYVEGNRPIEFFLDSSHEATRGEMALASTARSGAAINGAGVSVAVIDTGVDPTHPFFTDPDGSSIVVANLKHVCGPLRTNAVDCFADVGPRVDTDTASAGGHGTHVNGIVAGRPTDLSDGTVVRGAAPGAKIVSLSMGAGVAIINANLALDWVLSNHAAPCGSDVRADVCPPIKVVNNSYGPAGGGEFNPNSATVKLQRELAGEGVVTVWAAGNDGGDGSQNRTNPPGQDPTGGIVSVASYFDQNTGTRDGQVSDYSARGDSERRQTWPDISAPGQAITSACRAHQPICSTGRDPRSGPGPADIGTFNTISGTSMAAPHISGIVAQLFQAAPAATPAEIEDALKSTAHRFTDGAHYTSGPYISSYDKGTGLVDVVAALQALTDTAELTGTDVGRVEPAVSCVMYGSVRVGAFTHRFCI